MPPSSWPEGAIPPQTGSLGPRSGEGGLGPAPLSLFPYLVLLHGVGCLLVSAHGAAGAAGGGHPCAHVGLTIGALEMGGGGGGGAAVQHPLLSLGAHPHLGCPGPIGPRLVAPALVEAPCLAAAWSNDTHSLRAGATPRERASHDGSSITAPTRSPGSG